MAICVVHLGPGQRRVVMVSLALQCRYSSGEARIWANRQHVTHSSDLPPASVENLKYTTFSSTEWLLRVFGRRFISHEADVILYSVQKTSWADDVEDLGEHFLSLFLCNLTIVQISPRAKIISMKMAFGQQ